jgi:hypothetical protein
VNKRNSTSVRNRAELENFSHISVYGCRMRGMEKSETVRDTLWAGVIFAAFIIALLLVFAGGIQEILSS